MANNQQADKQLTDIKVLVRQGQYHQALLRVERALADAPEDQRGKWEAVHANLARARDDLATRLVTQIRSQLDSGAFDEARKSMEALSEVYPTHPKLSAFETDAQYVAWLCREARNSDTELAHPAATSDLVLSSDEPAASINAGADPTRRSDDSGKPVEVALEPEGNVFMEEMGSSLVDLMERLQSWRQALEKLTGDAPTAAEIETFRELLGNLEQADQEKASQLGRTLQTSVVDPLIARHQQEIDKLLDRLNGLKGVQAGWRDSLAATERLLDEVLHLSGTVDTSRRERFQAEQRRLDGEELLHRAEHTLAQGKKHISELEQRKHFSTIVGDAHEISMELDKIFNQAGNAEIAVEVTEKISHLKHQADELWEAKRRGYEGAVTADMAKNYGLALADLEYVCKIEGSQATVRYFPNEDATEAQPNIAVDRAIEICKTRWSRELTPRAGQHVTMAKNHIDQGNPVAANKELGEIIREDILVDDLRNTIAGTRRQIQEELKSWAMFHQAISEVNAIRPAVDGWRQLIEIGQVYVRFQGASTQWQTTRRALAEKAQLEELQRLRAAAQKLSVYEETTSSKDKLNEFGVIVHEIEAEINPWSDDMPIAVPSATLLGQMANKLLEYFVQIRSQLENRHLSAVQETLGAIDRLVKDTCRQLLANNVPADMVNDLRVPREYNRIRNILDSYRQADRLLERLKQQVRGTEQVSELSRLRDEITGYVDNVDKKYRADFDELSQYTNARYHFYLGRLVLNQTGDPDEAKRCLLIAANHDEFRTQARHELADIDRRLIPAEKAVQEALVKIERLVQQAQFWDAYQEGVRVEFQPVQKSLRQRLADQISICSDKALAESRDIIDRALESESGEPARLRIHTERLAALEENAMRDRKDRLWLLIHMLEAGSAIRAQRWQAGRDSLQEALKVANQARLVERVQDLQIRWEAVTKEYVLDVVKRLPPRQTLLELKRWLDGQYPQDADMVIALAETALSEVHAAEAKTRRTTTHSVDAELTALQQAQELLQDARSHLEQGSEMAYKWILTEHCPAYEKQRVHLLEVDPAMVANGRLDHVKNLGKHLVLAARLNQAKLDIAQQIKLAHAG